LQSLPAGLSPPFIAPPFPLHSLPACPPLSPPLPTPGSGACKSLQGRLGGARCRGQRVGVSVGVRGGGGGGRQVLTSSKRPASSCSVSSTSSCRPGAGTGGGGRHAPNGVHLMHMMAHCWAGLARAPRTPLRGLQPGRRAQDPPARASARTQGPGPPCEGFSQGAGPRTHLLGHALRRARHAAGHAHVVQHLLGPLAIRFVEQRLRAGQQGGQHMFGRTPVCVPPMPKTGRSTGRAAHGRTPVCGPPTPTTWEDPCVWATRPYPKGTLWSLPGPGCHAPPPKHPHTCTWSSSFQSASSRLRRMTSTSSL